MLVNLVRPGAEQLPVRATEEQVFMTEFIIGQMNKGWSLYKKGADRPLKSEDRMPKVTSVMSENELALLHDTIVIEMTNEVSDVLADPKTNEDVRFLLGFIAQDFIKGYNAAGLNYKAAWAEWCASAMNDTAVVDAVLVALDDPRMWMQMVSRPVLASWKSIPFLGQEHRPIVALNVETKKNSRDKYWEDLGVFQLGHWPMHDQHDYGVKEGAGVFFVQLAAICERLAADKSEKGDLHAVYFLSDEPDQCGQWFRFSLVPFD